MHDPTVKRLRAPLARMAATALALLLITVLVPGASRSLLRAQGPDTVKAQDLFEPPRLVSDIHPGSSSSDPDHLTAANGKLFFEADDASGCCELWQSDGTLTGTLKVRDLITGPIATAPDEMIAWRDAVYFDGYTDAYGTDLWKTDGTSAGTAMVKDINPGELMSTLSWLTVAGDTLYFQAWDDAAGYQLWKSDGTTAGTAMVKHINPGGPFLGAQVQYLTAVGETLFFQADDGTHGSELWKSDGTDAGTMLVKDITPGPQSTFPYDAHAPDEFIAFDGALYFRAGGSLWKSDGTPEGTTEIKEVYPIQLFVAGDTLYFWGWDDAQSARGLFKSDGTAAGTVLIKALNPFGESELETFATSNGLLYFPADDSTHGLELWKSDGTTAGTTMIADLYPGSDCGYSGADPCASNPRSLTPFGTGVVFAAADGLHGSELWFSDGTEAGTVLIQDLNPLTTCIWGTDPGQGSDPCDSFTGQSWIAQANGALYFRADDGTHGEELWALDLVVNARIYLPFVSKP